MSRKTTQSLTEFTSIGYALTGSYRRESLDIEIEIDLMIRDRTHECRDITSGIHQGPIHAFGLLELRAGDCRCFMNIGWERSLRLG